MKKIYLSTLCVVATFIAIAQDIQVTFPSDGLTLNGTLSLPQGTGKFPILIFVHGSGPNDRDQTTYLTGANSLCLYPGLYNSTVKNFKDLANDFLENGIAVLRYDKRTFTYNTQLDPKQIVPNDFIADINAAVEYVKTRSEIDPSCIMLLGHSQGCNLIPIIAQQRNDISALISLGAVSSGIDTILAKQVRKLYYDCNNDIATGDSQYVQILNDFQQIRNQTWDPNTSYLGGYPKFWRNWIGLTDSSIVNYNAINQPTLFLHAMDDFNIPLEDAQRIEQKTTKDLFYLNGLNHFFTTDNSPTVSNIVSDTILYWLRNNNKLNTLQIESVAESIDVNVYSVDNEIHFQSDKIVERLSIYDLEGRILKDVRPNSNVGRISQSNLSTGVYLVTIWIDNQSIIKRILK